ncbi:MAG TPA: GxxExxY protein [Gemmatimonadaceae bacterium]|nr:GxxExxY protein [Gemmatimonadaceae bacterium]
MVQLIEAELTRSVIGAFYEVYGALGYGFLEHVYEAAMELELATRGHRVGRQVAVRIMYKGVDLATQRLDMLVDDRVIVEIKSTPELAHTAKRQLHNYLRGTRLEVGLLLHFGPKPEFHRVVSTNARASGAGRGIHADTLMGNADSADETGNCDG